MFGRIDTVANTEIVKDYKKGVSFLGGLGVAKSIWSSMTSHKNYNEVMNYMHNEYLDNAPRANYTRDNWIG